MFFLQDKNTQTSSIGKTDGISEAVLKRFCDKHQDKVDHLFASKSQAGYHFLALPDAKKVLAEIQGFAEEQKQLWKHIVVLGIGGSALGTIAVRDALISPFAKGPKLHVVDNIDPSHVADLMHSLPLKKTLFIVISKSGGTVEPMSLYGLFQALLKKKFPNDYHKHFVFVTDPKTGLLRKIAKKEGIRCFDVPPKIGGRFSVLTAVGLLPCALAGVDVVELLRGARQMREALKRAKGSSNVGLKLAAIQFLLDKKHGKPMTVLMPYSNRLFRMGDWYRQLLAESIGKKMSAGPTPINALGTTDQHSQLQLYSDGPNNKFFLFMRVLKYQQDPTIETDTLPEPIDFLNGKKLSEVIDAAYQGTAEALQKRKRPHVTLEIPEVDARHLGGLFMLFEFQVALLGLFYKVNAFDQPGVEQSKQITKSLLSSVE